MDQAAGPVVGTVGDESTAVSAHRADVPRAAHPHRVGSGELYATLQAAIRAPSLDNSQPWHFLVGAETIEVRLDPSRMLSAADPSGRAARIACGAAVYNTRLAIAVELGHDADVSLVPDRHDELLMARVRPGRCRPATPRERGQYRAITRRHSNRYASWADEPLTTPQHVALAREAERQWCWLQMFGAAAPVGRIAELTHGPGPGAGIGAARDGLADSAAAVPSAGVLGGAEDTAPVQVAVGEALQAVLLSATQDGLAATVHSEPFEVPSARRRLRALAGRLGTPFLVLRVGYPDRPLVSTPRLPVTAVTGALPVVAAETGIPAGTPRLPAR